MRMAGVNVLPAVPSYWHADIGDEGCWEKQYYASDAVELMVMRSLIVNWEVSPLSVFHNITVCICTVLFLSRFYFLQIIMLSFSLIG
jgi:hypothetical protein